MAANPSSRLDVDTDELSTYATQILAECVSARPRLDDAAEALVGFSSTWNGGTSAAAGSLAAYWKAADTEIVTGLNGLGSRLQQARDEFESTDDAAAQRIQRSVASNGGADVKLRLP